MAAGSCRRLAFCVIAGIALVAAAAPAEAADSAADPSAVAASAAATKRRAERADYQLLFIYPDEATWRRLRTADLDSVMGRLHQAGLRLSELLARRKGLNEKAEFYTGKALPSDLQGQMDESDAALTASMYVFRGLEQDIANVVAKYEHPRARLKKLWAGAPLGSMGPYDPSTPDLAAK